jgi:hypothetical protein
MTERSYEDAVQLLRRRIGGRWEGMEVDGRDEMVRILKDELGYDSARANDTIDAMVRSGSLRYHPPEGDADPSDNVAPLPIAPVGAGAQTGVSTGGLAGTPVVPAVAFGRGYWQIGPDSEESGSAPGRAGQVDPTA